MKTRLWLTRHLGAPANAEPAAQAEEWLRGRADLLIAGMSGQVPAVAQLGVLAHADLGRLADLGRNSRLGAVRRTWGLRTQLPFPGPRRRPERRPRAIGSTA
jgi:hypothetical protein